MYVPNYVPEQLEVPGNITLAPYMSRVLFIRRVTALHLMSLALITALCLYPFPATGWMMPAVVLSALLILLDLLRIALRGRKLEAIASSAALPCILLTVAWLASELLRMGIPVWCVLAGPLCCGLYTLCCGRDYSFVGCLMLSMIVSSTALAGAAIQVGMGARQAAWGLGLNAVYLVYFVYDLASLMARRRRGEEVAAVVDLYRDIFNFFGYIVRVIGHWKRHRIWALPNR
jgi:FtsH-binding integral membrane protein